MMITNTYLRICQRYSELQMRKESEDIFKFIEISKLNLLVRRTP